MPRYSMNSGFASMISAPADGNDHACLSGRNPEAAHERVHGPVSGAAAGDAFDSSAGQAHAHSHAYVHCHAPRVGQARAFALAVGLNVAIVAVQAVYGALARSTALLADAGHNLSDVLGLLLAWGAIYLSARRPSVRYTFGLRSTSILASLANAVLLLLACGAIVWEAVERFFRPAPVAGITVFVVASAGMLINGFSAWLLMAGSKEDLNTRGAFLHMAADAAISAMVAVSGLVIALTGWFWVDPVMSLAVVAVVVYGTWGLLRESTRLALSAVPVAIDTDGVRRYLLSLPGVADVHDLHIWGLSTTENCLIAHLVMPTGHPGDDYVDSVVETLKTRFKMHHATMKIDLGTSMHACALSTEAANGQP